MINKVLQRKKRHQRIRQKMTKSLLPRLSVFRSNQHAYAQIIDDPNNRTLVFASDLKIKKGNKLEMAKVVGLNLARVAKKKKITKVVFDRGGFKYHGRVKALAQGAREGGLIF